MTILAKQYSDFRNLSFGLQLPLRRHPRQVEEVLDYPSPSTPQMEKLQPLSNLMGAFPGSRLQTGGVEQREGGGGEGRMNDLSIASLIGGRTAAISASIRESTLPSLTRRIDIYMQLFMLAGLTNGRGNG
jgi:hypothetical protein